MTKFIYSKNNTSKLYIYILYIILYLYYYTYTIYNTTKRFQFRFVIDALPNETTCAIVICLKISCLNIIL